MSWPCALNKMIMRVLRICKGHFSIEEKPHGQSFKNKDLWQMLLTAVSTFLKVWIYKLYAIALDEFTEDVEPNFYNQRIQ